MHDHGSVCYIIGIFSSAFSILLKAHITCILKKHRITNFNEISKIILCFNLMNNEEKNDFIFYCEDCDILFIFVNSRSEMYNEKTNYI